MTEFNATSLLFFNRIFWIILALTSVPATLQTIHRVDPLALLSGTLRTYQRAGCESEQVSLSCPRGTSISVELAQYGKDGPELNLCPASSSSDATIITHSGTEIEVKPPESCSWPKMLQYSLLQIVVEACQKKRHCKFTPTPGALGRDPCPGVRKFVEVAFKCRPYEFRSKVACENDIIQLICNPYSRIAIYSASYGRTEYDSIQCSQPIDAKEETCLVSYATETVMQKCHGKRRCTLAADSTTFGKPCRQDSRMYLKVVYTCVPRKVLKDVYGTAPEPDEEPQHTDSDDQDDLYDEDQFYRESEAIPPEPKIHGDNNRGTFFIIPSSSALPPQRDRNELEVRYNNTKKTKNTTSYKSNKNSIQRDLYNLNMSSSPPFSSSSDKYPNPNETNPECAPCDPEDMKAIGFVADWINAYIFLAQNQERFYLYLIVSIAVGILLCLTILIGRLLYQKRRAKKETNFQKSNTGETTLPNGFSDDISEIDADIDLTSLPVPSVTRSDQNYGGYTPSPSPYGNLGPSNISHTSTTMLVPMQNPSAMIGPAMPPTMNHITPIGTIPRYSGMSGPPTFMSGGSIIGHSNTLGRQSQYIDANTPRSLSRGGDNAQYYYG